MEIQAVQLVIAGRVQGVGYRASAQAAARDLGIRGWVRNRPDGTVEILAEGEAEPLERFVAWCREGPPAARVSRIDRTPVTPEANPAFEIR